MKILVITGPTASGKSGLGIALAHRLNGEIVSADSMQIYKGMEIGTAAVSEREAEGIRHYLVGSIMPGSEYSVVDYRKDADKAIAEIAGRGKLPIVVGGSGMYVDALLYDLDYTSAGKNEELRKELAEYANINGAAALHRLLENEDPETAEKLHENDIKRVIRALEICRTGQIPSLQVKEKKIRNGLEPVWITLECSNREYLYERINKRTDIMMQNGLLDEVKRLLQAGVPEDAQCMKAIGYRQLIPCLTQGADLHTAQEEIKQESRRYAKRQLTWMRARDCLRVDIYGKSEDELLSEVLSLPQVVGIAANTKG